MRSIVYSRFGGPEVLTLAQGDEPLPGPDQVRIRVAGCGVNPIDYKTRQGLGFVSQVLGTQFQFVPGYDVSGNVDAVGSAVTGLSVGEAVFGLVNFPLPAGAYADTVIAPAQELVPAPTVMPLAHAAGLPIAGLTAWQALFDIGQLQAGERVLVLAGAGGVGHLATQLAAWKGAQVSATASAGNHSFLRRHGVGHPLDYHNPAEVATQGPWDLILDLVGGNSGIAALDWLAPGGRLVTVPTNTAAQVLEAGQKAGQTVLPLKVAPLTEHLRRIAALVDQGELHLHVSAAFSLEEAATAHEQMEQGHTRGKLILVP